MVPSAKEQSLQSFHARLGLPRQGHRAARIPASFWAVHLGFGRLTEAGVARRAGTGSWGERGAEGARGRLLQSGCPVMGGHLQSRRLTVSHSAAGAAGL